jgi:hypothetical protein
MQNEALVYLVSDSLDLLSLRSRATQPFAVRCSLFAVRGFTRKKQAALRMRVVYEILRERAQPRL